MMLIFILAFAFFHGVSAQRYIANYTPEQQRLLADDMLAQYHELPHKIFNKACANPTPEDSNLFFKYVLDIHKELENYEFKDNDGILIKRGWTYYQPWADDGGWKCEPDHLTCQPPEDLEERVKNGWMSIFRCKCATTTIINSETGGPEHYKSRPVNPSAAPSRMKCIYEDEDAYCSALQHNVLCKSPDKVCLIDDFNVRCNETNYELLLEYLDHRGIAVRSDDCKCRPRADEVTHFNITDWSTVDYIIHDKKRRFHSETCANVQGFVDKITADYVTAKKRYSYPPEAKIEFDKLRAEPGISECYANRELYCEIPPGEILGKCLCEPVPARSGFRASVNPPVEPDGYCALESRSDCSTWIDNNFHCIPPEQCLIELVNTTCSLENLKNASQSNWVGDDRYTRPGDERLLKRCLCTTDATYVERDTRFIEKPKIVFGKKRPLFDLGYGRNDNAGSKLGSSFTLNIFWVNFFLGVLEHFGA